MTRKSVVPCVAQALWLVLRIAGPATAADLYVAPNGTQQGGTNWGTAFTNVQAALDAAQTNDILHLAGQTFVVTNRLVWTGDKSYVTVRGGYEATNAAGLGDRDPVRWPTVLARHPLYATGVLGIGNVTNATLDGVVLSNGYPGLTCNGGGMIVSGTNVNLLVANCLLVANSVSNTGASVGGGALAISGAATFSNCVIRGNRAVESSGNIYGGAVLVYFGGVLTLRDCVVADNYGQGSSVFGAGIYLQNASAPHSFRNCLFVNNYIWASGSYAWGAGLSVRSGASPVHLENCTFVNNRTGPSYGQAGGVQMDDGLTVTATNCIFWGNGDDISGAVAVAYCDIEDGDAGTGCFSADPRFDRGLYLAADSPCVNAGSTNASALGWDTYTTQADGGLDTGRADLGYHHVAGLSAAYADLYVSPSAGDDGRTGTNWAQSLRTITRAIALAREGTRIHLATGYYTNGVETFPLYITQEGVQVLGSDRAATVISPGGVTNCLRFHGAAGDCRVEGVTITGGDSYASGSYGAAVNAWGSMLTLEDCVISNNTGRSSASANIYGGALSIWDSAAVIRHCLILGNSALDPNGLAAYGGGLGGGRSEIRMERTVVAHNRANSTIQAYGGGLSFQGGELRLVNCLVASNDAAGSIACGDGVYSQDTPGSLLISNCTLAANGNGSGYGLDIRTAGINTTLRNSLLWGNGDDLYNAGNLSLHYSCTQQGDGYPGNGNTNVIDPGFVDTAFCHLQSRRGDYRGGYFSGGTWSRSDSNSPLIDAGDPASDWHLEGPPHGCRVNLGAYGNTPVASRGSGDVGGLLTVQ